MQIVYHCETHTYYSLYYTLMKIRENEDLLLSRFQESPEYKTVKDELTVKRTIEDVWIQLENSLNAVCYDSGDDSGDDSDDDENNTFPLRELERLRDTLKIKSDVNISDVKERLDILSTRKRIRQNKQLHSEVEMCREELRKLVN